MSVISGPPQDDPGNPFIDERASGVLRLWDKIKARVIAFSYDHPALMRGLFLGVRKLAEIVPYFIPEIKTERGGSLFSGPPSSRILDPFVDVRRTEDIIYTVASDLYSEDKSNDQFTHDMHNSLKNQLKNSEGNSLEILGRQRGRRLIDKWSRENNPDREWGQGLQRMMAVLNRDDMEVFKIKDRIARRYSLKSPGISPANIGQQLFSTRGLPLLVHGHFHMPRRGAAVVDEGCMLTIRAGFDITTYVRIDNDGQIFGP